jgi:hypothetical protein
LLNTRITVWYPNTSIASYELPEKGTRVLVRATCDEISCFDPARSLSLADAKLVAEWKRFNPPRQNESAPRPRDPRADSSH